MKELATLGRLLHPYEVDAVADWDDDVIYSLVFDDHAVKLYDSLGMLVVVEIGRAHV